MSKLIQMRNRIKAIETIRKITHAMRLISMSSHSHLKSKQEPLTKYLHTLSTLLTKVQAVTPNWSNPIINPTVPSHSNPLIIFVGSPKGLCGNFNTQLFKLLAKHLEEHEATPHQFIAIGKKAVDHIKKEYPNRLTTSYMVFSARNFLSIAQELITIIMEAPIPYSSVVIISNVFKSFFIQQPTISRFLPFNPETVSTEAQPPKEGYIWDQQPQEVLDFLAHQYLTARLQYLLFQSLLAEHAARFISMDNSTRNANNLLETTRLTYNKLRQTKITTELTELTGSF